MKMPALEAGIFSFRGNNDELGWLLACERLHFHGCSTRRLCRTGQAQAYPTRSITMIVPLAAGGPADVIARIVSSHIAQTLD
jgi:hypothetical protein